MKRKAYKSITALVFTFLIFFHTGLSEATAKNFKKVETGNFGLPGVIDLPTGKHFPDGELVLTQQLHKSLARAGISFQALPRLGVSFRYSGHGVGGPEAYGRFNHDRSFDAHFSITDEGKYLPAFSIGLRDFIGTGHYSSEYFVGTKSIGKLEFTAGLGFGRLAGRGAFSNPLKIISTRFEKRDGENFGKGGTLGSINWFQGEVAPFYGFKYKPNKRLIFSSEYTPDLMTGESGYLTVKSPWNYGVSYQLNTYVDMALQYLHGSEVSITANVALNPNRPPLLGGKELAPVPMRLRGDKSFVVKQNEESLIRKVLAADNFEIHYLKFEEDSVRLVITNTKFRSTAQAVGRLASTIQRFTSDDIRAADISFVVGELQTSNFHINLEEIAHKQFGSSLSSHGLSDIHTTDLMPPKSVEEQQRVSWGIGPYFAHRLFNPDLPLSMEMGVEFQGGYRLAQGLKLSGSIRKSIITNLTDNKRLSDSILPHVHSDWPLYDFAGQNGHIHQLTLSYMKNLAPGLYGRLQAGLLEPFLQGLVEKFYTNQQDGH